MMADEMGATEGGRFARLWYALLRPGRVVVMGLLGGYMECNGHLLQMLSPQIAHLLSDFRSAPVLMPLELQAAWAGDFEII